MVLFHNHVCHPQFPEHVSLLTHVQPSLVLYMIYYPQNLKYIQVHADDGREGDPVRQPKITKVKTDNWSLSIILSWVVLIHM